MASETRNPPARAGSARDFAHHQAGDTVLLPPAAPCNGEMMTRGEALARFDRLTRLLKKIHDGHCPTRGDVVQAFSDVRILRVTY